VGRPGHQVQPHVRDLNAAPDAETILARARFPREKQGMAMAMFGLGVVGAPIIGPFLGGWLTDNYSWRWVFNINIPIGVLAVYLIARYVEGPPYIRDSRPGTIDKIGFGLLTVWLASLQIVLDKGQQDPGPGGTCIPLRRCRLKAKFSVSEPQIPTAAILT
jgi:DHA2 family multidrug resistance protein